MLDLSFWAYDIETTGLSPYNGAQIFAFCVGELDHGVDVYRDEPHNNIFDTLQDFWNDTRKAKIAHNLKFELSFNHVHGIVVPDGTIFHDTMIMSQMLRNNALAHSLDKLADDFCQDEDLKRHWREIDKKVDRQAIDRGSKENKRFDLVDKPLMRHYQVHDGERTLLLFHMFHDDLKSDKRM
jgi:DNA polymerase I-like protein with 3'-5' exonuclease and polymerase domains